MVLCDQLRSSTDTVLAGHAKEYKELVLDHCIPALHEIAIVTGYVPLLPRSSHGGNARKRGQLLSFALHCCGIPKAHHSHGYARLKTPCDAEWHLRCGRTALGSCPRSNRSSPILSCNLASFPHCAAACNVNAGNCELENIATAWYWGVAGMPEYLPIEQEKESG